jgi:hypothetical protein
MPPSKPNKPPSNQPALTSRFKVYKNPLASTFRLDMALPAAPGQPKQGEAYVGELQVKTGTDGLRIYTAQVRALSAEAAVRDHQFAAAHAEITTDAGSPAPGVLVLTELNRKSAQRAGNALRGEVLLSSGRYIIRADFGSGDFAITGEISRAGKRPRVPSPPAREKPDGSAPHRRRTSSRRRRPSNDKA